MTLSTKPARIPEATGPSPEDCTRFIILSGARTGSHMLATALDSHPDIRCFQEVFNRQVKRIQYGVVGYDGSSAEDKALRARDPVRFLNQRIFSHPTEVRAAGFKFGYGHVFEFEGLLDRLIEDAQLRVLHLRRRNLLRMLVSLKLAETTGVWLRQERPVRASAGLFGALRHPRRTAVALGRLLRGRQALRKPERAALTILPEELSGFVSRTEMNVGYFDQLFQEHANLTVFYEDLVGRPLETYARVQSFLGVEPRPLFAETGRQNPEPLSALVENYDELRRAFEGTPLAAHFE